MVTYLLNNVMAMCDTEITFASASRAELQKSLSLEEIFPALDLEEGVLKYVVTLNVYYEDAANGQVTVYLNGDE